MLHVGPVDQPVASWLAGVAVGLDHDNSSPFPLDFWSSPSGVPPVEDLVADGQGLRVATVLSKESSTKSGISIGRQDCLTCL